MGATELNVNKIMTLIKGFLIKFRSNESDFEEDIKFKPDPLEIAETSPPGFSFWALYGVLALLLIAILWASLSKIEVVILNDEQLMIQCSAIPLLLCAALLPVACSVHSISI